MTKRLVAMIAALMLSGVGGVFAQDTLAMKIVSFTGQIQIKTPDGSVVGVVPGAPIPNIPPGAEIQILSGDAVFQTGQTVVKANAGDAFTYTAAPAAGPGAPQQTSITAVGDKTELLVSNGKTEATVAKGDVLGINSTEKGATQFQAVKGDMAIVSDGKASTLQQGTSMVASTPAAAAPAPVVAPPPVKPATTTTTTAAEPTTEVVDAPVEPLPPPPPPNPVQEEQTASPSAP